MQRKSVKGQLSRLTGGHCEKLCVAHAVTDVPRRKRASVYTHQLHTLWALLSYFLGRYKLLYYKCPAHHPVISATAPTIGNPGH